MRNLLSVIENLPEYQSLAAALTRGAADTRPVAVAAGGLNSIHKAHIAASLAGASTDGAAKRRPLFIIVPDDMEARRVADDVGALLGVTPVVLPPREFTFHEAEASSREWENRRVAALAALLSGEAGVCVSSVEAAAARTMPPDIFKSLCLSVAPRGAMSPDSFADALIRAGYKRSAQVEGEGQFAVRGGIIDFFSPGSPAPVRVELWGDEVDTVSCFDVSGQRRTASLDRAEVLPAAETVVPSPLTLADKLRALAGKSSDASLVKTLTRDAERFENGVTFPAADRWIDLMYQSVATSLDYLPAEALVVVCDHGRVGERAGGLDWQSGEDYKALVESGLLAPKHANFHITINELYKKAASFPLVYLDTFIGAAYPVRPRVIETFQARQLPSYGGSLDAAVGDVRHYTENGTSVVLLCRDEHRARRLDEMLRECGVSAALDFGLARLPEKGEVRIALGSLSAGFEYPYLSLAVITEGQFTPDTAPRSRRTKRGARDRVRSYTDLTPGDYVVHEHHGIARFTGIVTLEVDGVLRDYVKLAFLGQDALYVPATQLDLVSKFIGGGEDAQIALSKLGGADWGRRKYRAKAAAKQLAEELIKLYAERRTIQGIEFPPDDELQLDFEGRFEFDETDDQLTATEEIKADMCRSFPMDRLLCGDVGFGKTEVALRAVMKCILAGRQAAILVPTTVLAQQHFLTATRRFSGYAVTVDVMSRFRTPAQLKATAKAVTDGRVDFLIGTHRILQKDINFKNLGLLIVDEEQRFGVTHKERLKELAKNVDVLTLSATPIPRTLGMALSGIRDMSSLEDAPRDRHPVQTYVLEQDDHVLMDAIRRELSRGGQVYYLHNRVESIDVAAGRIYRALNETYRDRGDIVVAAAHGQMSENELADVMTRMEEGAIHVLVCTTIIETGIDIPNVNTLIVENADRYGLAQLHQLRGRVGRSNRHAYAYLCYKKGKVLTEIAEKRLTAIREFAEFGAGFKIAMRDLEIRGAGAVLGHAQSGHMMKVGYDMYLKLLEEAVAERGGDEEALKAVRAAECTADLLVTASIPERYVADAGQRMDLYRRIALVRTEDDAADLIDEMIDRYGDMPDGAYALIRIARLRYDAGLLGVTEISQKEGRLNLALSAFDMRAVSLLCADKTYRGRLYFSAGAEPALTLKLAAADPLTEAEHLVTKLAAVSA